MIYKYLSMALAILCFQVAIAAPKDGSQYDKSINFVFTDENHWHKSSTQHFSALSKYEEPYPDLNPTIYSSGHSGPYTTPDSYFTKTIERLKASDSKAFVSQQTIGAVVGGYPAYYKYALCTTMIEGKPYPAIMEYWAIPRGKHMILLTYGASKNNWAENREEAMKIIESLEFKN